MSFELQYYIYNYPIDDNGNLNYKRPIRQYFNNLDSLIEDELPNTNLKFTIKLESEQIDFYVENLYDCQIFTELSNLYLNHHEFVRKFKRNIYTDSKIFIDVHSVDLHSIDISPDMNLSAIFNIMFEESQCFLTFNR